MVSRARGADIMDPVGKKTSDGLPPTFSYKTRVVLPQIVFPQPLILNTLLDFIDYYTRCQSDITSS